MEREKEGGGGCVGKVKGGLGKLGGCVGGGGGKRWRLEYDEHSYFQKEG